MSDLDLEWVKLIQNGKNPGLFKIRFVPFGVNLIYFGSKSDNAAQTVFFLISSKMSLTSLLTPLLISLLTPVLMKEQTERSRMIQFVPDGVIAASGCVCVHIYTWWRHSMVTSHLWWRQSMETSHLWWRVRLWLNWCRDVWCGQDLH